MAEPGSVEFSIGRVIGDSFGVLARNFVSFFILALLIGVLNLLYGLFYANPAALSAAPGEVDFTSVGVGGILGLVINGLTQAAIVYGTFQDLRGNKASIGECISRGLATMLPVIVATLLYAVVLAIGFALLIIPGIFVLVIWWVYVPAIVVEDRGIFGSFGRSAELTSGRRWRILGLLLVVVIIAIVVNMLVGVFAGIGLFAMSSDPLFGLTIVEYVMTALVTAFSAVLGAVSYYYLRAEKEGIDVNEIAQVFD